MSEGYAGPPSSGDDPLREDGLSWSVITVDARILSLRSLAEVRAALRLGLLSGDDRLLSGDGATLRDVLELHDCLDGDETPTERARQRPSLNTQPYGAPTDAPPVSVAIDLSQSRLAAATEFVPEQELTPTPLGGFEVAEKGSGRSAPGNLVDAIASVLGTPVVQVAGPRYSLFEDPLTVARELEREQERHVPDTEPPRAAPEPRPSTRPESVTAHSTRVSELERTTPPVAHSVMASAPVRARSRTWQAVAYGALAATVLLGLQWLADWARHDAGEVRITSVAPVDTSRASAAFEHGDLALAEELLDATRPVDHNPQRALLLARVLVAEADSEWLAQAAGEASDSARASRISVLAQRAQSLASLLDPSASEVLALRADAFRVSGDIERAAKLARGLQPVSGAASAYSLAALALSGPAANPQRAAQLLLEARGASLPASQLYAMRVYALTRAGMLEQAQAELERLRALAGPAHPAEPALARLLEARRSESREGTAAHGSAPASPKERWTAEAILARACDQAQRGRWREAEYLYGLLTRSEAHRVQALTGLGDVALATHQPERAQEWFDRAAELDSRSVAALVGQADALWERGATQAARSRYRFLISEYAQRGLPARVWERTEAAR